jgi:ADP-heptose:LPS heptosyltransferase
MKLKIGAKVLGYKKTYVLPFKFHIPNYAQEFLKKKSVIKTWLKFIKRHLYIILRRQKSREIYNIGPEHKNILWINISASSLGDSLMDLSGRVLLKDRKIDLYTDKKNANLYQNDFIFSKIFTHNNKVDSNRYDLVIIDSYSTRSINIKAKIAPFTVFVGMFGYYNGPEVNRVLFSFHQLNHLLGYINNEVEVNKIAKSSMSISIKDQNVIQEAKLPRRYIAIALGGEWSYRTYNEWDKVVEKLLINDNNLNVIVLGSDNGIISAKKIMDKFSHMNVFDCVAKFTFNQTSQIIKQAQILLCCDGGLMHSANAVNTPIVALFAKLTAQMQLTESICAFSLYDKNNVNNISVQQILQKYNEAANFVCGHPPVE